MARVKLTTNNSLHKPVIGGDKIEALIALAIEGGLPAVQAWVAQGGDVNMVADPGNRITALHALMRKGANAKDYQACVVLLQAGANPNVANVRGETPLARAVITARQDYLLLLLEHGAQWDYAAPDRRDMSARNMFSAQMAKAVGSSKADRYLAIQSTYAAHGLARVLDETLTPEVSFEKSTPRRPRL